LRSYLAEKLNCDPMRITKKFTGACCLGRRAYHLRDRPPASQGEVDVASLELQHLEQRFRLRVEHEQSGLPMPPRHELLAAHPPSAPANVSSIPTLLASLNGGASMPGGAILPNPWVPTSAPPPATSQASLALAPGALPFVAGNLLNFGLPNASFSALANSALPIAASQLLLQASNERYERGVYSCDFFCYDTFILMMLSIWFFLQDTSQRCSFSHSRSHASVEQPRCVFGLGPGSCQVESATSTTAADEHRDGSSTLNGAVVVSTWPHKLIQCHPTSTTCNSSKCLWNIANIESCRCSFDVSSCPTTRCKSSNIIEPSFNPSSSYKARTSSSNKDRRHA
jgi:hypothetical protein